MMAHPEPGTYLLPMQTFKVAYCLRVEHVVPCDDRAPRLVQLQCKRWGLNNVGQPFDDGHHEKSYHTDVFRPVGPTAWRCTKDRPWSGMPIYFKKINFEPKGQKDLFA